MENYLKLEEQGLLLSLPCNVGDTFWELNENAESPYVYPRIAHNLQHCVYALERLEKTTFLTQSEAEKKLRELGGRMSIVNARITDVSLGYTEYGILTFGLVLEIAGGCNCVFGGYALDSDDKTLKKRIPPARAMKCLTEIMRVVGVKSWENLNGKYIRIVDNGWGGVVDTIGNILDDEWFNIREFSDKKESSDL